MSSPDIKDLQIERIEVIPVRVPLDKVYEGSFYKMDARCTIVTRVYTACGIVGESYNGDTDAEQPLIVRIITDELSPALLGKSAASVESCWEAMQPATYDILRDRSLSLQAIACVDAAIWDAYGKAVGAPLYQLWGGYRDRLPAICIGGYYTSTYDDIPKMIANYRDLGFGGCKFKVGRLSAAEDATRTRLAREAAGDDFVLMVDANQGFTRQAAIEFCRLTADLDITWFEEPCQWFNDQRDMRDVRLITGVPITAGQSEHSRNGFRTLLTDGAIDYCNADSSWIGGATEWRRIANMALLFGIQMAHHEELQVAGHLLASIPHGSYAEAFDPVRDPVFWKMFANRLPFENGDYVLPSGPGLGMELDWDFIRHHAAVTVS